MKRGAAAGGAAGAAVGGGRSTCRGSGEHNFHAGGDNCHRNDLASIAAHCPPATSLGAPGPAAR